MSPGIPPELALLAPGTGLREGLDRIVRGRTGALVVLGHNPELAAISTGGFALDVPFSPTGLRELAKMDGAIVLSADLTRILAASVHLSPSAALPTSETGTRHRTAERVARQTGIPAVTVSASMATISLFAGGGRVLVPRPEQLLDRANQAIAALMAHRVRLLGSLDHLTDREINDAVTLRDLAAVAQRFEMINRVADETAAHLAGLGIEGRLVGLQLRDLTEDLSALATLLQRDYAPADFDSLLLAGLHQLSDQELFDVVLVARSLGFPGDVHLDSPLHARGHRQLASIPRLPASTRTQLVERFGSLTDLAAASVDILADVEGVGPAHARQVRAGLSRIVGKHQVHHGAP